MGDNIDIVFVIFVFIMVLLFFILLLKRLYMRQNLTGLINEQLNGHGGPISALPGAGQGHDPHGNSGQIDTAPPPFETVVGLSKGEFKSDNLSCDTSHLDMECPPPSYEEYLGVVNGAYADVDKEDVGPGKV